MPVMNTLGALVAPKAYYVTLPDGLGWIGMSQVYDAINRTSVALTISSEIGTRNTTVDSSNNLYIGYADRARNSSYWTKGEIEKLDSSGISLLSQEVYNSGFISPSTRATNNIFNVVKDSSNNLYSIGMNQRLSGSTFYNNWYVAKHDSSYNLTWQYNFYSSTTSNDYAYQAMIDSLGNPYVLGVTGVTSTFCYSNISKLNTSGGIGWSKSIASASSQTTIKGSVLDSSNNAYVIAKKRTTTGSPVETFNILKIDSTGALTTSISINAVLFNIAIYGSYLYVATDRGIIKLDTSLTILDQKQYVTNAWNDARICVNNTNTSIVVVGIDSTDVQYIDVIGVDSSLNVNWSNRLMVYTVSYEPYLSGVSVSNSGNSFIITYNTDTKNASYIRAMFSIQLPIDGRIPMSGIYAINSENITYTQTFISASTTSYTTGAATVTVATQTLTSSTPNATDLPGTSWITQEI